MNTPVADLEGPARPIRIYDPVEVPQEQPAPVKAPKEPIPA